MEPAGLTWTFPDWTKPREAVGSVFGGAWLIPAGSRRRFNLYFDRGLVN